MRSTLLLLSSTALTAAQLTAGIDKRQVACLDPSFIPCGQSSGSSGGSSGGSSSGSSGSSSGGSSDGSSGGSSGDVSSSPQYPSGGAGAAMLQQGFENAGGLARRDLGIRQVTELCCSPTVQCRILTDGNIPFCYVSFLISGDLSCKNLC
jgi:hypothetical protein